VSVEDQYKLNNRQSDSVQLNGRRCDRHALFPADFSLGDAFADGNVIDIRLMKSVKLLPKCTHATNGATFQLYGCVDPSDWRPVGVEFTLAATQGGDFTLTAAEAYCFVKYKAKRATPGSASTVGGFCAEKT
jgi:hypothetical protein